MASEQQLNAVEKNIQWIANKKKESTALINNIQQQNKRYVRTVTNLESLNAQAEKLKKEYTSREKILTKNLADAELFYNKEFYPLKLKINDRDNGLKKAILIGESFFKEIETKRSQVLKLTTEYTENVSTLKRLVTNIKRLEKSSSTFQKKSSINEEKIAKHFSSAQKSIDSIKTAVTNSKELNGKISEILKSSKDYLNSIESIEKSAEKSKDKILSFEESAESTERKIHKLYEIITNKSMAGAFDNIKTELTTELGSWYTKIMWSSLGLSGVVITLFITQLGINNWTTKGLNYDFYLRFLIVTPIVYYMFFCSSQYKHIRDKLDKYTFKTTVALSIEAYTDLLSNNFTEKEDKTAILKFSLESLRKIYDRPYIDELLMAELKIKHKENTVNDVPLKRNIEFVDSMKSLFESIKK